MRVLSWNILHGGGSRVEDIIQTIDDYSPDIVSLQEYRHGKSGVRIRSALKEMGHECIFAPETDAARDNSIILASCLEFTADVFPSEGTRPARCIAADFAPSGHDFKVVAAHFPQKRAQLAYFEALLGMEAQWSEASTLIVGDLNCGIPFEDSETRSFYATHLFQEMLRMGWIDAWRSRNPEAREFTWISQVKRNGYRYDHAIVTAALNDRVSAITYDHDVREDGRSDHSLLVIDLD